MVKIGLMSAGVLLLLLICFHVLALNLVFANVDGSTRYYGSHSGSDDNDDNVIGGGGRDDSAGGDESAGGDCTLNMDGTLNSGLIVEGSRNAVNQTGGSFNRNMGGGVVAVGADDDTSTVPDDNVGINNTVAGMMTHAHHALHALHAHHTHHARRARRGGKN